MSTRTPTWPVPIALLGLGTVPVVAGSLRVVGLSGGADVMPADARYTESPLPVVLHIVSGTVFAILGAFQFSAGLRRRHPRWHRRAGRVLVVAAVVLALSALWLNQFFRNVDASREVIYPLRVAFGLGLLFTIVFAFTAIRRRDIARHRAWMMRSYAIGLVAGTQVFTLGFGRAVFGDGEATHALLMGAAWAVNLTVAEWAIRRPARRTHRTRRARGAQVRRPVSVPR